MKNQEVAEVWANKTNRHLTGSHMFSSGDTIYSYGHHFPMARQVTVNEEDYVLLTTRKWSNSTSTHHGCVCRACKRLNVLCVPDVKADGIRRHKRNMKYLFEKVDYWRTRATHARAEKETI